MSNSKDFSQLASQKQLELTISALEANNVTVSTVADRSAAKAAVLALLPEHAQVMTMTSITLEETGLAEALNTSDKYQSVRTELESLNRDTDGQKMQQLGAAPEWTVGSVHAITQSGQIVIASNTGSQLPAYAYGAKHVVWVVGAQKLVSSLDEAMQRLNEYVIPLESVRARKAYGLPESFNSAANKLLILNKEVQPGRLHVIFVNEKLGF